MKKLLAVLPVLVMLAACAETTAPTRTPSPSARADQAIVGKTACDVRPDICGGTFSFDHLVITTTQEYNRLLADVRSGQYNPPYNNAVLRNQWNGAVPLGSGIVWHYEDKWTGVVCDLVGQLLPDGGICLPSGVEMVRSFGSIDGTFYSLVKATHPGWDISY